MTRHLSGALKQAPAIEQATGQSPNGSVSLHDRSLCLAGFCFPRSLADLAQHSLGFLILLVII
jgi:hypothetical protein